MNMAHLEGNLSHQGASVQIDRGENPVLAQDPELIGWEGIKDVHKMHSH